MYDDGSNVIESISRQRCHDAPASQTGELKDPSTTPKARVTYAASYADGSGRNQASANYGTNGGTALSRSSTIPTQSDDILVHSQTYDDAGTLYQTTDAAGLVVEMEYDDAGRTIKQTTNPQATVSSTSGGSCDPSDDTNVIVETAYNADGNVDTLTAVNSSTGNQVTEYTYGTTLTDSDVASSLLLRTETYPDSASGSDVITYAYDRQSQRNCVTDQIGTVHSFDYDKLGRMTQDRVTTLGTNVDGAVRRIGITYGVRGQRENVSSYDNATVGSGNVVNEVEFAYNDFGQLVTEYQAHSGSVNTSTTPKVQYSFANGSDNTIRPTSMTYPDSSVLTYEYGTSGSIDDAASRVHVLDWNATDVSLYEYLGLGTIVNEDYLVPGVELDYVGTAYSGFDRFGRIIDQKWKDSSATLDQFEYTYDRSSNRLTRENKVSSSQGSPVYLDELYDYDSTNRLKEMERGQLASGSISSPTLAQCWQLDATGNWKQFSSSSPENLVQQRTANVANEITNVAETAGTAWSTPSYDANGNMVAMPQPNALASSYDCTYDAWNRLVEVEDNSTVVSQHSYDAINRRIKNYFPGLTNSHQFLFNNKSGSQCLETREATTNALPSSATYEYVWSMRYIDAPVLREDSSTAIYFLNDANFNVTTLIDNTGSAIERYVYDPHGKVTIYYADWSSTRSSSNHENVYLFTGRELDIETGIYYFRARYYHAELGNFVNRDPTGYVDGYSLYAAYFVPNHVDPSGLDIYVGDTKPKKYKIYYDPHAKGKNKCRYSDGKKIHKIPCPKIPIINVPAEEIKIEQPEDGEEFNFKPILDILEQVCEDPHKPGRPGPSPTGIVGDVIMEAIDSLKDLAEGDCKDWYLNTKKALEKAKTGDCSGCSSITPKIAGTALECAESIGSPSIAGGIVKGDFKKFQQEMYTLCDMTCNPEIYKK